GNAKVIRSINPYLDKEALRVVGVMPRWKPGM
ncbi:energy transducer TonB, partial [Bacteroides cellulosilyticus]|nr:energy transducer TonB [Bacteroides cellulosilyticus]